MDVFFETQGGKMFSIELGYFDTVLEIKEKIQKYQGMPINSQTLVFSGQVLEDERDIEYCEILHNSHIQLLITSDNKIEESSASKKIKLMVLTKCGTKKIPVEVNAADNVGQLRQELQKLQQRLHFHLPPQMYFFIYKQNMMDDDRSFKWHHVRHGDSIEIFSFRVNDGYLIFK